MSGSKKVVNLFLAAVIIAFFPAQGFADRRQVSGFSVSGAVSYMVNGIDVGEKIINAKNGTDALALSALTEMLNAAFTPSTMAIIAVETAKITLTMSNGDMRNFSVMAGEGRLFAKNGTKTLELDKNTFHNAMNALGGGLYRHRDIPVISGKLGNTSFESAYIEETTYAFRKLDNRYYRPWFKNELTAPERLTDSGKWGSLAFSVQPEYCTVSVYAENGKKPLFTATSFALAGEYAAKRGDSVIKVRAVFNDKTDAIYCGEVTYTFISVNP